MSLAKHWVFEDDIVLQNLKGLVYSNPNISLIPQEKVIVYNKNYNDKVTIISGGGAGHEPLHAGFVGANLLDAAVSGSIFASPSTKQILAAIKSKPNNEGTLIIVKNYTGDILHFGLVAERAKAEGLKVELVIVADDVSVNSTMVGRRGLAATALVHKITGSAASDGLKFDELADVANGVAANSVTIAASLDHCSVPGRAPDENEFTGKNEAEIGLGIHNEPSVKKISPIPKVGALIDELLHFLLSPDDKDRHFVNFNLNDKVVLLMNNIGGTSSLELYAITNTVVEQLKKIWKINPVRVLISDFVTSLNSPGFSVTLLNVSNIKNDNILSYLDKETDAPGWKPKSISSWKTSKFVVDLASPIREDHIVHSKIQIESSIFKKRLISSLKHLLTFEPKITHYDTVAGDGDCGETLAAGANAILKALNDHKLDLEDPACAISQITNIVEDAMGGTSGGLYAIYLTALGSELQKVQDSTKSVEQKFAEALYYALYDGLFKYTKARAGGRTLVDTLQPFVDELHKSGDFIKANKAAQKGAESTRKLAAKFGRASYVSEDEFKQFDKEGGLPDPGAVGLAAIIDGFINIK